MPSEEPSSNYPSALPSDSPSTSVPSMMPTFSGHACDRVIYGMNCLDGYREFCDIDGTNTGGVPRSICTKVSALEFLFDPIMDFCGPCYDEPVGEHSTPIMVNVEPSPSASSVPSSVPSSSPSEVALAFYVN
jgi:hypothetical protein